MKLYTLNDISTTTAATNSIITTEELGYYATIPDSLSSSVNFWIGVVSSKIDSEINHVLKQNTWEGKYSYKFNSETPYQNLFTDNFPIYSVSSIQYRISPLSNWLSYSTSDLEINNNKILFFKPELITSDYPKNLKITYTAGYQSEDIPAEIKEIAIENVIDIMNRTKEGVIGVNSISKSTPSGTITTTFKDLSDKHKKILAKYKKSW